MGGTNCLRGYLAHFEELGDLSAAQPKALTVARQPRCSTGGGGVLKVLPPPTWPR